MTNEFKYLRRWSRPPNYMGADYSEYYPACVLVRDSNLLEQSNFNAILTRLGGESETVRVERATHWAFGWIETIYVHETDLEALHIADTALGDMAEYPVLDEDDFDRRAHEATLEMLRDIDRFPDHYPDRPDGDRYEYARTLVLE